MKNIYLETTNNQFTILQLNEDENLIEFGFDHTIKTKEKLEEILVKKYFADFNYKYLGELDDNFPYSKLNDHELNSKTFFMQFLSKNNLVLENNYKYYIFKKEKNGER